MAIGEYEKNVLWEPFDTTIVGGVAQAGFDLKNLTTSVLYKESQRLLRIL